jgi:branched-chain amino acid transport system permease protein
VFGLGAVFAGLAGLMAAPIASVKIGMGDDILILAFVIIVIGGIGSIKGAFVAAMIVGQIDIVGRAFLPDLLKAFLSAPRPRPRRPRSRRCWSTSSWPACWCGGRPACSGSARDRLAEQPRAHARIVTAILLLLLAVLPLLTQAFDQRYLLSVGTRIVIWSIAAVSLNMILGYGGLVSFGHAAFFGIGGYAVGILSAEGMSSGWIQWPVALAVAVLWATVVGALSLRTRGVYFIMITLAFAQLVYYLASGLEGYGGDDGLNIGRSRFSGLIDLRDKATFYWLCFALLCGTLWFCSRLANSRFGYVLRGARSNELRMPRSASRCSATAWSPASSPARSAGSPASCSPTKAPMSRRHDVVGEVGRPDRDRRDGRHRRAVRPALRRRSSSSPSRRC